MIAPVSLGAHTNNGGRLDTLYVLKTTSSGGIPGSCEGRTFCNRLCDGSRYDRNVRCIKLNDVAGTHRTNQKRELNRVHGKTIDPQMKRKRTMSRKARPEHRMEQSQANINRKARKQKTKQQAYARIQLGQVEHKGRNNADETDNSRLNGESIGKASHQHKSTKQGPNTSKEKQNGRAN